MRKFLFATVAVGALAGASAMAQNASTNPDTKTAATADKMNSSTTQQAPKSGPSFITVQNTDALSSNVVGLDVYNDQNNTIGKIQDIAFNESKQMTGYILSVGGFLGMGTHYVAVDPNAVMVQYDAAKKTWRATMNATKDELKSAPEFKYSGQWTASRS
ncbi:MAG TPA: PRC-barrel domain-containing protein [Roseiarcus sp.]|jgi:sporulation protein YlmC with PRC-barrel domain